MDFKKNLKVKSAEDLYNLGFNTPPTQAGMLFTTFSNYTNPTEPSMSYNTTINKSKGREVMALAGQSIKLTVDKYDVYVTDLNKITTKVLTGRATNFGGRINGRIDPDDATGDTYSGLKIGSFDATKGLWVALGDGSRRAPRNTMAELNVVYGDYIAIRNPVNGLTVQGILVDRGPSEPSRLVDAAIGLLQAIQIKNGDGQVQIWKAR